MFSDISISSCVFGSNRLRNMQILEYLWIRLFSLHTEMLWDFDLHIVFLIRRAEHWAVLICGLSAKSFISPFHHNAMQVLLIKHLTNSSRETLKFIAHCLWGGSEREGLPAASSWICPFGSFSRALVRFTCSPVGPFTLYTLSRPAPHNIQRWKMSLVIARIRDP